MSGRTKARLFWLALIAVTVIVLFATINKKTTSTTFSVLELQRAVQNHLTSLTKQDRVVENIRLVADGSDIVVTISMRGKNVGNDVRAVAEIRGKPDYAAIRKHMLFHPSSITLREMTTIGNPSTVTYNSDRRHNRSIDQLLGDAVQDAFGTVKATELDEDISSMAYFNKAEVKGDQITLSWDKVQTTVLTLLLLMAIGILLLILVFCPELLFWMLVFSS